VTTQDDPRVVHVLGLLSDLGLVAGATLQDVQRRLHVGTADAMRLLALQLAIQSVIRQAEHQAEDAAGR